MRYILKDILKGVLNGIPFPTTIFENGKTLKPTTKDLNPTEVIAGIVTLGLLLYFKVVSFDYIISLF